MKLNLSKFLFSLTVDLILFLYFRSLGLNITACLWISFICTLFFPSPVILPRLAIFLGDLFLRGGLFTLLFYQNNWPLYPSLFLAVLLSQALYFFLNDRKYSTQDIISLLIGYSISLRVLYMGGVNLIPEEAYYWNYSRHLAPGYLDHPPLVAIMIYFGTIIFGNSEIGIRIFTLFCWLITASFIYLYSKDFTIEIRPLVPLLCLAVFPVYFSYGFFTHPDALLFVCWSGSLFFLYRLFFFKNALYWVPLAICLGLGMLSKYTISLLGVSIIIFMIFDRESRKWAFHPGPYLAFLLTLFIFSPVIYWNATNNWASFSFQTTRRIQETFEFSLHYLLIYIFGQITPLGILSLFRRNTLEKRQKLFLYTFTFSPFLVFVFFSFFHGVRPSWTAPVLMAIFPMFSAEFFKYKKYYLPMVVSIILVMGLCLHYLALGIPGIPYLSDSPRPVAWREFGYSVEKVVQDNPVDLVVGIDKHFIASILAFYLNDPDNVSSSNLFSQNGLMYGLWFDPKKYIGKNMIIVGVGKKTDSEFLGKYFQNLSPVTEQNIYKNGKYCGNMFYRIGMGYISP